MPAERQMLFLDRLRESQLLESAQLEELANLPEAQAGDPQLLARIVFRRGWLSRYQLNLVGQGKARELHVGPYILVEPLGEGGMGQVFKAHHQHMQRTVALKVIRKDRLADGDSVKRFYKEVQAAAQLTHPNIVLAYDAGPAGNTHYFAMEYIEGVDLSRLVKESGSLPAALACEYIRQAALGLQHAHEQGLVHRDIKPANLLLCRQAAKGDKESKEGKENKKVVVKILDMGLARFHGDGEREKGLTQTGQVLGTPDYLAPEQAMDAHAADIRADIYSLGCSLYFLLAGKPPFTGETLTQVLLQHQMEKPPPIKNRTDLPEGLQEVIHTMMAKQPDDRFQTPAEVAEALAPFADGQSEGASVFAAIVETSGKSKAWEDTLGGDEPAPRSAGRKNSTSGTAVLSAKDKKKLKANPEGNSKRTLILAGATGGGVLLLLLLVLVIVLATRRGTTPVVSGPTPPGPQQQGQQVAGIEQEKDKGKPVVKPPDPIRPANPGVPAGPAGTLPEGLQLEMPPGLGLLPIGHPLTFSPDGGFAAAQHANRIFVWDLRTGKNLSAIPPLAEGRFHGVGLSANGKQVLVGLHPSTAILFDVATGNELKRFSSFGELNSVALSADGRYAAVGGTRALMWETAGGTEVYRSSAQGQNLRTAWFSPDSKRLLFAGNRKYGIYEIEIKKEALGDWKRVVGEVSFCADGQRALIGLPGQVGVFDLLSQGLIGPPLALEKSQTLWVAAASDGRRAIVACNQEAAPLKKSDSSVRVLDLETWQELGRMEAPGQHVVAVAISPDGTKALFAFGAPNPRISLMDLTGTKATANPAAEAPLDPRLVPDPSKKVPSTSFSLTPDGRLAAFGGPGGAVVRDLVTTQTVRKWESDKREYAQVAITPDGRQLLTTTQDGLRLYDLDTGQPGKLLEGGPLDVQALAVSANGRYAAAGCGPGGPLYGRMIPPDCTLRVWDLASGQQLFRSVEFKSAVRCVAFQGAGNRLEYGDTRRYAVLEIPTKQEQVHDWPQPVSYLDFSRDSRRAVLGFPDGTVGVWDLGQLRLLNRSSRIPEGTLTGVAMSFDGNHFLTGSMGAPDQGTYIVRVWEVEPFREGARFNRHTSPVTQLGFFLNDSKIFTGSITGKVHTLDLNKSQPKP